MQSCRIDISLTTVSKHPQALEVAVLIEAKEEG